MSDGPSDVAPAAGVVERVEVVDDELVAAMQRLMPQLSSAPAPGRAELEEVVAQPGTSLLVARLDGAVVGLLTLVRFRIPSGVRAWIEDVVVDERARGRGLGELLARRALELAYEGGARSVELTSRPSRSAANRLYRRLGFEPRETNVYRHSAKEAPGDA